MSTRTDQPEPAGSLERGFSRIERVAVALAAAAVLVAGFLIVAGIVGRNVFGRGIPDAEIMVRDLMVIAVLVPLAVVAGRRAHIAIDLLVGRFPQRLQRRLNTAMGVLSLAFLVPIAWSGWQNLQLAWVRDSYYDGSLEWP